MFFLKKYGLAGILVLYIILTQVSFLTNPPVWPDEAFFADVAFNIAFNNRFGTDLWGDMIPSASTHFLYPPGLFVTLAAVFKVFGFSIYNQRLVSVVAGAGFLAGYFLLTKHIFTASKEGKRRVVFVYMTALFLILDNLFLRTARWSRPEVFVLFFSHISFLILFFAEGAKKNRNYLFAISGLLLGIGMLFHLMAGIFVVSVAFYWLYKYRLRILHTSHTYFFFGPFLFVMGIWALTIYPYINEFIELVSLQSAYRQVSPSYLGGVFSLGPFYLKLYYIVLILITPIALVFSFIKRDPRLILISICLLVSWVYAYFGNIESYPVLAVPLSYLFLVFFCFKNRVRFYRFFAYSGIMVLFVINLYIYSLNDVNSRAYELFASNLKAVLPTGSSVFVSSIPDAYFIVKDTNNKIYQSPPLPSSIEDYKKILSDTDYVVFNFDISSLYFGDFFVKYVDLNKGEVRAVGAGEEYSVFLIKLKDRQTREMPDGY